MLRDPEHHPFATMCHAPSIHADQRFMRYSDCDSRKSSSAGPLFRQFCVDTKMLREQLRAQGTRNIIRAPTLDPFYHAAYASRVAEGKKYTSKVPVTELFMCNMCLVVLYYVS
jgi:hypothetical protein